MTRSEEEIIIGALEEIGLKVSSETRKHIWLTYHSCAIERECATLEATAKACGMVIREKLLEEKSL